MHAAACCGGEVAEGAARVEILDGAAGDKGQGSLNLMIKCFSPAIVQNYECFEDWRILGETTRGKFVGVQGKQTSC